MKKLPALLSICLLAGGMALAAELTSGLPEGEKVPAFNVRDITGPNKGKTLCYRCQYGARPVVSVFTRELNDTVKDLVKKIDATVAKNEDKKMAAFLVVLTTDADAVEPKLVALADDAKLQKTPLTIVEGEAGPPEYNIAKDAEVTVMMWVNSEVKVNHAYGKGQLDKKAVESLVSETKKILD